MEQLINRMAQETILSREQSANIIDLLLQIDCSPSEIIETYERHGVEGLAVFEMSYKYKIAEFGKVSLALMTIIAEENKMKRFFKWICGL
jgi:hypothetical protein